MKEPMVIERADAQGILNYLKTRPYEEVCQLIPVLLKLRPPAEEEAEALDGESIHE